MNIKLRERQMCDNDDMIKKIRRTGIVTVNRDCLSQTQHTALLSTPRGHAWTGTHGLSFIMEKCRKKDGPTSNNGRRESEKMSFFDVNTTMWPLFVKQFLQHGEYSLTPATRIILTKILLSRVNFSDPKWSIYKNTQTELCRFLRNLNPECNSINWKVDFFRKLSSLIFNYMVQVLCSGRISKKQKKAQVILNKINDITNEYVLFNSPNNFLQGVQIFVANMLSPWLEKPINDICSKGTNNKDLKNGNTMNDIVNQRHGIKTKYSKNIKVDKNKTHKLELKTIKNVKTNQKSKKGQFKKLNKINNNQNLNTDYAYQTDVQEKTINKIDNQKIDIETKLLKTNQINQNKTNKFKIITPKKVEINKKSKVDKFTKRTVKDSLSSENSNKAKIKTKKNQKSKKDLKSKSVIGAVNDLEKIIENHQISSNSVLVRRPVSKNTIKNKIKNNKLDNSESENNHKYKKSTISKTIVKDGLSLQNPNKATKKKKTNKKFKKGLKLKSIIGAVNVSKNITENNEILSNSVLFKQSAGKNVSEMKIKSENNSNTPGGKSHSNTNRHNRDISGENDNYGPITGNEKLMKLAKQLDNENTFESDSNANKETNFINDDAESLRSAMDAKNTHKMIEINHDRSNDNGQEITAVDDRAKLHYDDGSKILSEHGGEPTDAISNRSTNSYYNDVNEDDRMMNVMDYSGHTMRVIEYLSGEKHDTNLVRDEEILKYNDSNSIDIDDNLYSDVNTDFNNGFDDDNTRQNKIMHEDGEKFESRILDDLAHIFLDSSSAGWSNKHENTNKVMETRGDKYKQNYFQKCTDGYAWKLADNFRNKASTRPEVCDQHTGVTYNICKKNGSNYSVRKTVLPLCKNRDHQCTMCSLDKSKIVVNTLIKLKY